MTTDPAHLRSLLEPEREVLEIDDVDRRILHRLNL